MSVIVQKNVIQFLHGAYTFWHKIINKLYIRVLLLNLIIISLWRNTLRRIVLGLAAVEVVSHSRRTSTARNSKTIERRKFVQRKSFISFLFLIH